MQDLDLNSNMFFGLPDLEALLANAPLRQDFSDLLYEGVEDLFDLATLHRASVLAGLRERKILLNELVGKKMQRRWPEYARGLMQRNNELRKMS